MVRRTLVLLGFCGGCLLGTAATVVDFTRPVGKIRPQLHSSGLGGQLVGGQSNKTGCLKELQLWGARTHDWALLNAGQRMLDTHFVFPLMHLDAKDPKNYFFGPTDEILKITTQDLGLHVMYRMGTSIESVNARRNWQDPKSPKPGYYNCVEPADWDQYAEVLTGIIRHYTEGWANGFKWGDKLTYWELWNEPNDRPGGSWLNADGDFDSARNWARFQRFYAHVLKILKSRFPHLKFGGPATCYCDLPFLRNTLLACKEVGYAPDFVSWHNYACRPGEMLETPAKVRALCDELGFKDIELVINEWHYLPYPEVWGDFNAPSEIYAKRILDPVNGLTGIESAIYTLQVIMGLQTTCLDQSYYYGCGQGYGGLFGIRNADASLQKVYYALKLFGTVVRACDDFVNVKAERGVWDPIQCFGAISRDRRRKYLIVSRYKGGSPTFEVVVKGLGKAKVRSVEALNEQLDLETVSLPAKAEENTSRTPFSPAVASPVFTRDGDTFTFNCWTPTSAAWLITFDAE